MSGEGGPGGLDLALLPPARSGADTHPGFTSFLLDRAGDRFHVNRIYTFLYATEIKRDLYKNTSVAVLLSDSCPSHASHRHVLSQ